MDLRALCSAVQAGIGSFLYVGDGDTLYAINFEEDEAILTGGVVKQVFTGGDDQKRKRGKRLVVEGKGTNAKAQLVLLMDNNRSLTLNLTGPYDRTAGVLFYAEFDPAVTTYRVACATLQFIEGEGVEIGDMRLDFTFID